MSFQAKRLRVQIPCQLGDSIYEAPAELTPPFPAWAGGFDVPWDFAAFIAHTCHGRSCRHPTRHYLVDWADGPETLSVDPIDLPVLKAQLEAQMKRIESQLNEIANVEQALKDRDQTEQ